MERERERAKDGGRRGCGGSGMGGRSERIKSDLGFEQTTCCVLSDALSIVGARP